MNTYYNNNMEYQTEPPEGAEKKQKRKIEKIVKVPPIKGGKLLQ